MKDNHNRTIDYMRISLTDRCNLRCTYCMPHGMTHVLKHDDILSYEELLRICRITASLGIRYYKITGGEPLARADAAKFIHNLKAVSGVDEVTLTTNALLLDGVLNDLLYAGLDAINISIDSLDPDNYSSITGYALSDGPAKVIAAIERCLDAGLAVKTNTVILRNNLDDCMDIAKLACKYPIAVRFIELMPIGESNQSDMVMANTLITKFNDVYPSLSPTVKVLGHGPSVYYTASDMMGSLGFIEAISNKFCNSCNRIRLTSTGYMKPCLCYDAGSDIKSYIRSGSSDEEIKQVIRDAILSKPASHCFSDSSLVTEHRNMNQIGG